jgi:hypothetical protein
MPLLTIRAEQMAVLGRHKQLQWLDERLSELYPAFAALSASERNKWIEDGLSRAAVFRLRVDEYLPFLCVEQTFGAGFADRPEYDWARRILEERLVDSGQRMRRLKKAAIRRLLDEEDRLLAQAAAAGEDESR